MAGAKGPLLGGAMPSAFAAEPPVASLSLDKLSVDLSRFGLSEEPITPEAARPATPASTPPAKAGLVKSSGLSFAAVANVASLAALPRVVRKRSDCIQVAIRCRPLIGRDAGQTRCFQTSGTMLTANESAGEAATKDHKVWSFDNVFDEVSTVNDIHGAMTNEVCPARCPLLAQLMPPPCDHWLCVQVVDSVMDGYHGTIFAYGQTGSGKTYTMVGDRKDGVPGVMTLAVDQMFKHISQDTYRDYMIRVSYMEIYNEKVRDLLNPAAQNEELKVRNDVKKGFFVECQEVVCSNDEQIYAMLDAGNTLRTTAATQMNAASSRSHAIFRMTIESVVKPGVKHVGTAEDNAFRCSYLNLVDLAGSERSKDTGATGATLKEAGAINLSLSCLSNIIRALADQAKSRSKKKVHLPFRDSKLTQILQPSLGGNSRTAFICTVTLAQRFFEETTSTLKFANQAKKVTNTPKKNILMNEKAMLSEAHDEIEQLKRLLKSATSSGDGGGGGSGGGGDDGGSGGGEGSTELENKIRFLETMLVGGGGANSLDVLNSMWTPELGKNAFDAASATQMIREAETKRVMEWRAKQMAEIDAVWKQIDTDNNGTLDPTELGQLFEKMGQAMDVDTVMAQIDEDGDGEVDKEEFLQWWCTRSVADRERLKGQAAPPSDRISKLKLKLKLGARIAGSVKRSESRSHTVGFAQMQQAMMAKNLSQWGAQPGGQQDNPASLKKIAEARAKARGLEEQLAVKCEALKIQDATVVQLQCDLTLQSQALRQASAWAEEKGSENEHLVQEVMRLQTTELTLQSKCTRLESTLETAVSDLAESKVSMHSTMPSPIFSRT